MTRDICSNRHGGNDESREAFEKTKSTIAAQQAEVLACLAANRAGLTSEEIEEKLGLRRSSVSARIAELKEAGLVRRKMLYNPAEGVGYERRPTRSGATAAVLVSVPK